MTELFISSGDGTVQAIQTEIAERFAPGFLPHLALLPHGTTNMTAADLGFRNRNLEVQADFIANRKSRLHAKRPTVRVANPRDGKVRHGMFLGTGAVMAGDALLPGSRSPRRAQGRVRDFRHAGGGDRPIRLLTRQSR